MSDSIKPLVSHSHIPIGKGKITDKIFVEGRQVAKMYIGDKLIYECGKLDSDIDVIISQKTIISESNSNEYELSYGEDITLVFYCVDGYGFDEDIEILGAQVKSFEVEECAEADIK